jgi:protein-S-isoprenylcysteine O-methyltransferase Ste14
MQVVLLWLIYAVVAFGFRTLVQLTATGKTGWAVLRPAKQPMERIAVATLSLAFSGSFGGAIVAALERGPEWTQPWPLPKSVYVAGFVLYAAGVALTFAAQLAMGKSWRIGVDSTERTELVAHGLFALVRNPIYSAMIVAVTGLTLMCCSALTCASLALLIVALELQVRAVEEPYLARTHGDAYARYTAKVGRFVPLLGRSR